jgi:hypothetical protein
VDRIHIDGLVFRDEAGAIWPWRGFTAFTLYLVWLTDGAAGVDALLSDWFSKCGPVPFNVVRVLFMVNSFAHLWPQEHANFYDELQPFARHLWTRWSCRLECVIGADSGDIMSDAEFDAHAARVVDTLEDEPNLFFEVANEPSAHTNLPGGDARAYDIYLKLKRPGVMIATGAGDGNYAGDYVTVHTPRDDQWPRKAKDLLDVRDIAHVPSVGDEPMGAAEVAIDGKRDNNPRNFADYAAVAQLEGAGSTFHSDPGINGQALGPNVTTCAQAFFASAAWVPPPCQIEPFMRGQIGNPCTWTHAPGDVPGPCQHDDSIETRSYAKIIEPQCWVTQVQTQRAQPTACAGWQADQSGPAHGLTRFRRT